MSTTPRRDSRDDSLGNGLPQGVDLGNVTTSLDSETDVDSLEPLNTDGEDRLVDLVSEDGAEAGEGKQSSKSVSKRAVANDPTRYSRLDDRDGGSVEPDQTLTGGDKGDGGGGLLLRVKGDKNRTNQLSVRIKCIRISWLFNQ